MGSQVYTQLAAQWDAVIGTGINNTIGASIAAVSGLIATAVTLWIIIFGYMMAFGMMSWGRGMTKIIQAAGVSLLLTTAYFNQFIQTPLMDTIPQWIASSTNAGNNAGLPQEFDQIRNQVGQREAAILQQATGLFNIGQRLECALITMMVFIELTVVFVIYEISRGMMGLVIAAAPFLIWLYVFDILRPVVMNLTGVAISILLLQLLLSIIVSMNVAADNAFLQQLQTGADVDVQIDGLMQIFVFFLFGLIMSILMPEIAARVGNGIMPSFSGLFAGRLRAAR